jgi:hypothetical protein
MSSLHQCVAIAYLSIATDGPGSDTYPALGLTTRWGLDCQLGTGRQPRTQELWQRWDNPRVCKEQVVLAAELPLCLVRLVLCPKLRNANHLGNPSNLLILDAFLRCLVALACSKALHKVSRSTQHSVCKVS